MCLTSVVSTWKHPRKYYIVTPYLHSTIAVLSLCPAELLRSAERGQPNKAAMKREAAEPRQQPTVEHFITRSMF